MTVEEAEESARRARQAFAKLEHMAVSAREAGVTMTEDFWAAFGKGYSSVQLAERAVSKAREGK